jgi:hypothetical protein
MAALIPAFPKLPKEAISGELPSVVKRYLIDVNSELDMDKINEYCDFLHEIMCADLEQNSGSPSTYWLGKIIEAFHPEFNPKNDAQIPLVDLSADSDQETQVYDESKDDAELTQEEDEIQMTQSI